MSFLLNMYHYDISWWCILTSAFLLFYLPVWKFMKLCWDIYLWINKRQQFSDFFVRTLSSASLLPFIVYCWYPSLTDLKRLSLKLFFCLCLLCSRATDVVYNLGFEFGWWKQSDLGDDSSKTSTYTCNTWNIDKYKCLLGWNGAKAKQNPCVKYL